MKVDKGGTALQGHRRAPQGPLTRPCPKCHASIGHRCRPLRQATGYYEDRLPRPHPERRTPRSGDA